MNYDDDLEYGDRQMIATFGRPVRLPADKFSEPILGIFDDPYGRTDLPHSGFITGKIITLNVISSEINGLASRDVIQIPMEKPSRENPEWSGWTEYTVKEMQPDGAGLSVVYLEPKTTSNNDVNEIY